MSDSHLKIGRFSISNDRTPDWKSKLRFHINIKIILHTPHCIQDRTSLLHC